MEKQVKRQVTQIKDQQTGKIKNVDPYIEFTDGSTMPLKEYNEKYRPKDKKIHIPRKEFSSEETAQRERMIKAILKYDMSAGMKYDKNKGFLKDSNGNKIYDEKTARDTLGNFTTKELKKIVREMPEFKKGADGEN